MKKELPVKSAGVAALFVFLLADRLCQFTWEVKMCLLGGVIILACVSLLLRPGRNGARYLLLGVGLIFAAALFIIQYFSA